MRWLIANEAHSAELVITITYPTSASGKTLPKYRKLKEIKHNNVPKKVVLIRFPEDQIDSTMSFENNYVSLFLHASFTYLYKCN